MKIKFLEKEIEVTKKFLQKASTFGTEEYTTLVKAMSDLPNFRLKVKTVKRRDMIFISKCHSQAKRYPVIKNWFLDKYPEVKKFGISNEENKVTDLPATTQEFKKAS